MFAEKRANLPPGYTGHLPFKADIIGLTTGEANKSCLSQYDAYNSPTKQLYSMVQNKFSNPGLSGGRGDSSFTDPLDYYKNQKLLSVGNKSRNAASWIGGPKHEVRTQRIPGYTGFMPGINSENLFGKSYAKCSAASLSNKIIKGHDLPPGKRFQSQNQRTFAAKNFRRNIENPDLQTNRDYLEYTMTINQQESEQRQKVLDLTLPSISKNNISISNSPSPQRNQQYYDNSNQTITPPKNISSLSRLSNNYYFQQNNPQVKAIVLEKKLATDQNYDKISDGFKRIFVQDDGSADSLVIPIAGYQGHRKGNRAENMFGKSYREATIQSKKLERSLRI